MTNQELYKLSVQADDAWHAELVRLFGANAGDVRYTKEGEGLPGSTLNALYLAAKDSCSIWLSAMRQAREKVKS